MFLQALLATVASVLVLVTARTATQSGNVGVVSRITNPAIRSTMGEYSVVRTKLETVVDDTLKKVKLEPIYRFKNTIIKSGECGQNVNYTFDSNGVLTIFGTGDMGYYISASNVPWDSDRANITSIIVSEGVSSIGKYSFEGCSNLSSVTIAGSVKTIDDYAFKGCTGLQSIVIPEGVSTIADYVFEGCSSLTSVNISSTVDFIGCASFANCGELTDVTYRGFNAFDCVGESACGRSVFENDNKLGNIAVPWNYVDNSGFATDSFCDVPVEHYGSGKYGENVNYVLSKGVLTIFGSGEMGLCASDTGNFRKSAPLENIKDSVKEIVVENGITSIGPFGFAGFSNLESVKISESVVSITDGAFRNCKKLTNVELPNGMTSIGSGLFSGCTSLKSVNIPNGVTKIGNFAFENCSNLTSITIPSGVTSIGNGAFLGCSSLVSIKLPSNMTMIEDYTFSGCSSLTSVDIPSGITSIQNSAFKGCSSLTSIKIPSSISAVGYEAFASCDQLSSVYYCGGPNVMCGENVFGGDSGLDKVSVIYEDDGFCGKVTVKLSDEEAKDSCKIVYRGACGSAVSYSLDSQGVLRIFGSGAMSDYYNNEDVPWDGYRDLIKNVIIENGVTSIGRATFYHCLNLKDVTVVGKITSIGDFSFKECGKLDSINIPNSVISIGNAAFEGSKLTSAIIPNSVTSIGSWSFKSCHSLISVEIKGEIAFVGEEAFMDCHSLRNFNYMGLNDPVCDDTTFAGCDVLLSVNTSINYIGKFCGKDTFKIFY